MGRQHPEILAEGAGKMVAPTSDTACPAISAVMETFPDQRKIALPLIVNFPLKFVAGCGIDRIAYARLWLA